MKKVLSKEVSTAMYVDESSNGTYEVVLCFKGVDAEQLATLKELGKKICNAGVTEFTALAPAIVASEEPEVEKMQQVCASSEASKANDAMDNGVDDDTYGLYKMSREEIIDWFVANYKNVAFIRDGEINLVRAFRIAEGHAKEQIEKSKENYKDLFTKNKSMLESFYAKHNKTENAFD